MRVKRGQRRQMNERLPVRTKGKRKGLVEKGTEELPYTSGQSSKRIEHQNGAP